MITQQCDKVLTALKALSVKSLTTHDYSTPSKVAAEAGVPRAVAVHCLEFLLSMDLSVHVMDFAERDGDLLADQELAYHYHPFDDETGEIDYVAECRI